MVSGPAGDKGRKHVRALCESPQGERIRQEIANFNRSFLLAGISDNRKAGEATAAGVACEDKSSTARLFVPVRCIPNEWSASIADDKRLVKAVPIAAISPLEYGFMASGTIGYFGDWKAITPYVDIATGRPGDHVFRSSISLGRHPLQIRTIGIATSVAIDGVSLEMPQGRANGAVLSVRGQQISLTAEARCATADRHDEEAGCASATRSGRPVGTYLTLAGTGSVKAEVEIRVATSVVAPRELRRHRGLPRRPGGGAVQAPVFVGADRVRMQCTLDAPRPGQMAKGTETGCELAWEAPEAHESAGDAEASVDIRAGDLRVIDPGGALTQRAFELGMGDLVGLGVEDAGSLAQVLARAGGRQQVSVTIDPKMQQVALRALDAHARCSRTPCDRRADLVLMDAEGETAGEVLAAVGWPGPARGLSAWDIETLERSDPRHSPVAGYAWRNHDRRSTPGSSFKVVTALAASQEALNTGDPELTEILLGTRSLRKLANRLGIVAAEEQPSGRCIHRADQSNPATFNLLPVPGAGGQTVYCISNATQGEHSNVRSPLGSIFRPGTVSGCESANTDRAGLCEALKYSSNLYFAGLALSIDGAKLVESGKPTEHAREVRDLVLARQAERLFPFERSKQAAWERTHFDVLDVDYPLTGRARSSPLVVDAVKPLTVGEPRRLQLARGGIGLSISASPLVMTSVAASVATGRIVRPHAIPLSIRGPSRDPVEGQPVLIAPVGREKLRDELLGQIRQGMAAVVLPGGTANASLRTLPPELLKAVRAKTGTAPLFDRKDKENGRVPPEGPYAAWMIGYVEPPGGNSGIKRRMAFACRIAYAPEGGGATCGPVVRELLRELHRPPR